jgi:hypothetical protein
MMRVAFLLADLVAYFDEMHAIEVDDPTGVFTDLLEDYRVARNELAGSVEPPTTSSR